MSIIQLITTANRQVGASVSRRDLRLGGLFVLSVIAQDGYSTRPASRMRQAGGDDHGHSDLSGPARI